MCVEHNFTKNNLDFYLKELAKEFRRRNGNKMPAEIILVGGAAILANYSFREMTNDIDAEIGASSAMREAIAAVADRFGLKNGWLNSDFSKTDSYSPKLRLYSKYYRTYSGVLNIRTVSAEYLVAMKLVSYRRYKKDISDIIGIIEEQKQTDYPLTFEKIDKAVCNLYGGWDLISENAKEMLADAFKLDDLSEMYQTTTEEEQIGRKAVLEKKDYVTEKNIDRIINAALEKKQEAQPHKKTKGKSR